MDVYEFAELLVKHKEVKQQMIMKGCRGCKHSCQGYSMGSLVCQKCARCGVSPTFIDKYEKE